MIKKIPFDRSKGDRLRRLRALIIKECYQIVRDPSSIMISVVLPLVFLFLYGYGVSLDLNHLRIGLVMEDTSPDCQSFAKSLTNSPYFDVKFKHDRREMVDDITRGTIRGFVVIPSYFSAFRHRHSSVGPIQVIADGSEPNTANFVLNYVQGAYQNWLQQEKITSDVPGLPLIDVQSRFWYNEQLESRFFLLSGSLAITMTLIGTLLTALVVAREWERGTMEALMSTTVGVRELVMGKVIPYFFLGMISMVLSTVVSVWVFDLPLRGSWWLLGLTSAIFLFSALGFGLMISTIAKNQIIASQISIVAGFMPAYILSGFVFEIASMPRIIQWLTYVIPARYFVKCLQTLFLVGDVWELILRNLVPMIIIGSVFLLITARKTVKRLD